MRIILSILLLSVIVAQTDVSGLISSNANWTQSGSPYTITGSIFIDATLTIEEGVTIKFGETSDYNITVLSGGKLVISGTSSDSIKFKKLFANFLFFEDFNIPANSIVK